MKYPDHQPGPTPSMNGFYSKFCHRRTARLARILRGLSMRFWSALLIANTDQAEEISRIVARVKRALCDTPAVSAEHNYCMVSRSPPFKQVARSSTPFFSQALTLGLSLIEFRWRFSYACW